MPRHEGGEKPQRSCLACRETRDRDRLIRFVLSPQGEVVPDLDAKLPGRGAYTCIDAACLAAAVRQRQFGRAFKREVAVPAPDEMTAQVARLLLERVMGYIALANKAGKIVAGGSMVGDALKSSNKPGLVLVAQDVSEAIGEKIEGQAAGNNVPCRRVLTKDDFGALLGKAPRSAIGIKSSGFVAQLLKTIERYRNFLGEVQ
ncbi:DUF448 domain-containing protein [Oryzomonas sagensis]|uniref:DUF448 domain-containing protein n=1 Tax=Oryzomonas sagensis TaxID=2603857 RepID=A0ABQ6TPK1_9BACT|nr:DUF448 domain-containing protein [Oryzomonas sagensis]KAB0670573.1 DUF448 domain-containing protein [Oryzomonas sagensis]